MGNQVLPGKITVEFYLEMPRSWSKKKQAFMEGKPHKVQPDADNFMKAFKDVLCENDGYIWDERSVKLWSYKPKIILYI